MLRVLAVLRSVTPWELQFQSSVGSRAVCWPSAVCNAAVESLALSVTAECCSVLHTDPVLDPVALASTVAIVLYSDQGSRALQ